MHFFVINKRLRAVAASAPFIKSYTYAPIHYVLVGGGCDVQPKVSLIYAQ